MAILLLVNAAMTYFSSSSSVIDHFLQLHLVNSTETFKLWSSRVMTPYSEVVGYQHFRVPCCLHFHRRENLKYPVRVFHNEHSYKVA